jgi:hypothetical protein
MRDPLTSVCLLLVLCTRALARRRPSPPLSLSLPLLLPPAFPPSTPPRTVPSFGIQTLFDEWDADADGSLSFLEFEGGVNLFISTTTQPLPGDVEETRSTRAMVQAVFDRLAVGGLIAIETVVEQRASIEEEGLIMPDHIDELLVTYDEDADLCLTAQVRCAVRLQQRRRRPRRLSRPPVRVLTSVALPCTPRPSLLPLVRITTPHTGVRGVR